MTLFTINKSFDILALISFAKFILPKWLALKPEKQFLPTEHLFSQEVFQNTREEILHEREESFKIIVEWHIFDCLCHWRERLITYVCPPQYLGNYQYGICFTNSLMTAWLSSCMQSPNSAKELGGLIDLTKKPHWPPDYHDLLWKSALRTPAHLK